ncbi:hypothetical protein L198_05450 [Cryptococcus wingfieldii CBS 7118]|uniref:Uncharacterized protein n=1 Tax=Cryptococcus wingfieldii CBS 7118 TaxID=1295528 RepID=A0A1E3J0W0_9TREE|nr:hypothetical protein L198_05450 [Cryptococcus wingfieldii CBS 7118]ODN93581.1 hypothetical protein L198_05450 [Cryptococcus wingfieldii CBS 7118]
MPSQQPEDLEGASHQEEAYTHDYPLSEDTTFDYDSQEHWGTLGSLAEQGFYDFDAPMDVYFEVIQQASNQLHIFHGRPFSEAETAMHSIIQTVMESFLRRQREADRTEERQAGAEQQEEVTRQFGSMLEDPEQWWPEGHGAEETLQQLRESISDINLPDVAEETVISQALSYGQANDSGLNGLKMVVRSIANGTLGSHT